jgi:hypothetical protein
LVHLRHAVVLVAAASSLTACSGLTQVQDSISKFDQSTHSVATAQTTFFEAVQAADCDSQFYDAAYSYAQNKAPGIDLRSNCSPRGLTDAQLKIRQTLLASITLYADQLQALAAAGDSKQLSTNEQSLASNINSFAQNQGFAKSGIAADVEAAIIGLTGMVLDYTKFATIQAAAAAQQDNLSKVVTQLKAENIGDAAGIDSNLSNIRDEMATELARIRKTNGPVAFFYVANARSILTSANPLGSQTSTSTVQQLNASLDAIVSANQAIASAGTGGIVAAVNDLVARAQQAQAVQAALIKQ